MHRLDQLHSREGMPTVGTHRFREAIFGGDSVKRDTPAPENAPCKALAACSVRV